jgi:hypothetical protein
MAKGPQESRKERRCASAMARLTRSGASWVRHASPVPRRGSHPRGTVQGWVSCKQQGICRDACVRMDTHPRLARLGASWAPNASRYLVVELIPGVPPKGGFPANSRESAGTRALAGTRSPVRMRSGIGVSPKERPPGGGRWREACRSHVNARAVGHAGRVYPTCALKNRSRAGPRSARNSNCGFSPIRFSDIWQIYCCQDSSSLRISTASTWRNGRSARAEHGLIAPWPPALTDRDIS